MRIWTLRSASIQKRTDCPKFEVQNADLVVGTCTKVGLLKLGLERFQALISLDVKSALFFGDPFFLENVTNFETGNWDQFPISISVFLKNWNWDWKLKSISSLNFVKKTNSFSLSSFLSRESQRAILVEHYDEVLALRRLLRLRLADGSSRSELRISYKSISWYVESEIRIQ